MPRLQTIQEKLQGKCDPEVTAMIMRVQDHVAMQEHKIKDLVLNQLALAEVLRELMDATQNALDITKAAHLQRQISSFDKKHEQNSPLQVEDDFTDRTEGN